MTGADRERPLVLILDVGRGGVRAAAVADDGTPEGSTHVAVTSEPGDHGWDEQATDALWRATLAAVRGVLDVVGPDRLGAVGVTTDPVATVLWDRETLGSPRRAARAPAVEVLPRVAADEPHTWALLEEGGYAVGDVGSWLVARTTLGTWHLTDPTHAAATGLLGADGAWSTQACLAAGVPTDALPELVPTTGRLATTEARAFHGLTLPVTALVAHGAADDLADGRLRRVAAAARDGSVG